MSHSLLQIVSLNFHIAKEKLINMNTFNAHWGGLGLDRGKMRMKVVNTLSEVMCPDVALAW